MPGFEFFDANLTLGKPCVPKGRIQTDAKLMREELARFGIAGGLVKHTLGAELHPLEGNERLSAELSGIDGFEPVWAVMPHWTGEFPEPHDLVGRMAAGGVRAAIVYPGRHGFPLRPSVAGELLSALEELGAPLFLPAGEVALETAEEMARDHPALPLVICDTSYRLARELYAVLGSCPNVHLEISGYMVPRGIEDICRRFGAERLVFGSRYPTFIPGAAVAAVMYAAISEGEKALIASGNAARLLAEGRR